MKRLMIFMLCLWMLAASAGAENAPLQLTVTGKVTESSRLSDEGLRILNTVLSRLMIRQTAFPDGERAELVIDGKVMWSVERRMDAKGTVVIFSDMQGYRTAADEPDALMLLSSTGREMHIPLFAPDAYEASAADVYDLMHTAVEPVLQKSTTTVQHAASSPRYDRYTLTAEQMNILWPKIVATAQPHFDRDGGEKEYWQMAAEVVFTGDVRIKRLYDTAGKELGIQLTGNGILLGTERKISLLMGYTKGKGGSLTLSAKALKGKDNLKINASLKERIKEEETTYTLNCDFTHVLQGETKSGDFALTLKHAGDAWSGKASWQQGNKSLTVEGSVLQGADGMQGNAIITEKEKKKVLFGAELLFQTEKTQQPEERQVPMKDLSGMNQERVRTVLYPEEMTLMRALMYLLNDLPEEARWHLTHELRTDNWHTGDDVPVINDGEQWIVEEDTP